MAIGRWKKEVKPEILPFYFLIMLTVLSSRPEGCRVPGDFDSMKHALTFLAVAVMILPVLGQTGDDTFIPSNPPADATSDRFQFAGMAGGETIHAWGQPG